MRHTDILLLASTIYFGDVSSQLKTFIDRTFFFLLPDYATNPTPSRVSPGRKLLFVLARETPMTNDLTMFSPDMNHSSTGTVSMKAMLSGCTA